MSIPAPEIRLAILFSAVFAVSLFIGIIIIMHSLGNMSNHLSRMEFLVSKEITLRYNQQVNYYKQQQRRELDKKERNRRQEALLAIPLVRNADQKKKERL